MHKVYFFPEKKCVCLPYLEYSDPLLETHFFLFGPIIIQQKWIDICFSVVKKFLFYLIITANYSIKY